MNDALKQRERYYERKRLGLCTRCGAKTLNGTLCEECKIRFGDYLKERRKVFRSKGLCAKCGKRSCKMYLCDICRENEKQNRINRNKRKELKLN